MPSTNGAAASSSSASSSSANGSDRPLILICNDDGIDAPGIIALASALDGLGDLVVAAPVDEQSAVGHAITVRVPVRAHTHAFEVPSGPIAAHAILGTPADCIKLSVNHLVDRRPDLVVSGINHGPNTAVNIPLHRLAVKSGQRRGSHPGHRQHCLFAVPLARGLTSRRRAATRAPLPPASHDGGPEFRGHALLERQHPGRLEATAIRGVSGDAPGPRALDG